MHLTRYPLWLHTILPLARAALESEASPPHPYDEAVDNGTFGYYPTWTYATEADIAAPKINWLQWDPRCDDGMYYFLTPRGWGIERPGPMILDWKGDLVWTKHFANEWGGQAYDFMVQHYQGHEYLTFWTGDDRVRGHGSGSYMMLDSSYELVHDVDAAKDLTADLHEFSLTSEGTALITVYQKYQHDMSGWRTFNATDDPNDADRDWIWDCVLQEISVDTRDVIFEWRASEHVALNDTYHNIWHAGNHEDPFDWFHLNSIEKDELGNYLISARYTHSISYIDGRNGDVLWVLGGKSNIFMDLSNGIAINFAWQHDARFVSPDSFPELYTPPMEQKGYTTKLLSLFDNAAEDQNYVYGMNISRGLLLEVTFPTPGSDIASNTEKPRDISHLLKLAAQSNNPVPKDHQATTNLPIPSYGDTKLHDPTTNALKIAQTNSTNPSHTVRVIQSFANPLPLRSSSQGSLQLLPPTTPGSDARVFVGYGLNAVFTTFDANGSALCDAHYGATTSWERGDIQSYRAYKFPWVGRPRYPPRLVVAEDGASALVSWNGATEVKEWVLQTPGAGKAKAGWRDLARAKKEGFETSLPLPGNLLASEEIRFLRALALDAKGEGLEFGVSEVWDRNPSAESDLDAMSALTDTVVETPPSAVLLFGVLAILAGLALFEAYRRYLCWRVGGKAVGAVRWRKGVKYWGLGEA